MKNWLSQLVGLCSLLFVFSACEKDETQATLTPSNMPTLSASANTIVLTQANETQNAVTFTWTPVSSLAWGNVETEKYKPAISYSLQVAKPGTNFAYATTAVIDAGAGPTTTVKVADLNTALGTLGLAPNVAAQVEVRLRATYAANSPLYSPVVPLTVTPYKVCLAPAGEGTWSIIGPAGVDWNTDVPLTYNCDTKTYNVTRALNAGEFKFRKNNDWATNYGANARNPTGPTPLVKDGSNIVVPAAGVYTIAFNLTNLTYTLTQ